MVFKVRQVADDLTKVSISSIGEAGDERLKLKLQGTGTSGKVLSMSQERLVIS